MTYLKVHMQKASMQMHKTMLEIAASVQLGCS